MTASWHLAATTINYSFGVHVCLLPAASQPKRPSPNLQPTKPRWKPLRGLPTSRDFWLRAVERKTARFASGTRTSASRLSAWKRDLKFATSCFPRMWMSSSPRTVTAKMPSMCGTIRQCEKWLPSRGTSIEFCTSLRVQTDRHLWLELETKLYAFGTYFHPRRPQPRNLQCSCPVSKTCDECIHHIVNRLYYPACS